MTDPIYIEMTTQHVVATPGAARLVPAGIEITDGVIRQIHARLVAMGLSTPPTGHPCLPVTDQSTTEMPQVKPPADAAMDEADEQDAQDVINLVLAAAYREFSLSQHHYSSFNGLAASRVTAVIKAGKVPGICTTAQRDRLAGLLSECKDLLDYYDHRVSEGSLVSRIDAALAELEKKP